MPKKIIAFLDELDKKEVLDCAKEYKIGAEIIFCDTCEDFEKALKDNPEGMMVYSGRLSINGHHIELRRIIDNNPSILFRKYGFNCEEYIHKKDLKVKNFYSDECRNIISAMYHAFDIFNEFYNNIRLDMRDGFVCLAPQEKLQLKHFCGVHGDEGPPPSLKEFFNEEWYCAFLRSYGLEPAPPPQSPV
ncbi:MAG: hypothetical protein FWB99_07515 [Treponema sp.]|nr:hypothetical protein [Treponema sp.]